MYLQAASTMGVEESELEGARGLCRGIQRRKELITKMRKVGRCWLRSDARPFVFFFSLAFSVCLAL